MRLGVVKLVPGVGGERRHIWIVLARRQLEISSTRLGRRRTRVQLLLLVFLPKLQTLHLKFCRWQEESFVTGLPRTD